MTLGLRMCYYDVGTNFDVYINTVTRIYNCYQML